MARDQPNKTGGVCAKLKKNGGGGVADSKLKKGGGPRPIFSNHQVNQTRRTKKKKYIFSK